MLPRSLRSVADVHAARTEEKVGHSSPFGCAQGRRDDGVVSGNGGAEAPTPEEKVSATGKEEEKEPPRCRPCGGGGGAGGGGRGGAGRGGPAGCRRSAARRG